MGSPGFVLSYPKDPKHQDTAGTGIAVTFANGVTVSVQFGPMNYCANRDTSMRGLGAKTPGRSSDAECTVFDEEGQFVILAGNKQVQGWIAPDEVLAVMVAAAKVPKGTRAEAIHVQGTRRGPRLRRP